MFEKHRKALFRPRVLEIQVSITIKSFVKIKYHDNILSRSSNVVSVSDEVGPKFPSKDT